MRIAMVTTHPPSKGSLNEYAYHFARYLRLKSESASELFLLVDQLPAGQAYPDDVVEGSIPVTYIPCWKFGAIDNILRIQNTVKKLKPDIVLFNVQFATFADKSIPATLGLLTPWLLKRSGFSTVVLLHNIMETVNLKSAGFGGSFLNENVIRFFGSIVTRFLLSADLVAVTIPKYVDILTEKYKADNVILAPHGSFEEQTNIQPNTMPAGEPNIMTFGKFGTYKKVEILIEAFEMLLPQHPNAKLVIAGTDSPNVKGYLDGVQKQYSHVPNVQFTGYVSEEDVPRIFGDAWVVVFPYTSTTGSSGVLHQAGGFGKAVALPNLGDLAELVQEEGYDGEFFEPTDARSLYEAISRVIDHPERQLEIGSTNFMAANGLPINDVVDWYLIHFQELLKKK
ncbi:MAG: glycosyltransferase [Chloroflexota bacterium]